MKSDQQIRDDVVTRLRADVRVGASDPQITVNAGVVTLTGTVSCLPRREAAQNTAATVAGVINVKNDLTVDPSRENSRPDGDIAHAARQALEWNAVLPENEIHLALYEGWVTLDGSVEYAFQRDEAQRQVEYLRGVRGVTNQIRIIATASTSGSRLPP